jgi:PAS domain S-box-containing protein
VNGRASGAERQDRPDTSARRVAELEAEVAAPRRALARAGLDAGRVAERHRGELAEERVGRAADAEVAPTTAAEVEARHGRETAADRADLAAERAANAVLGRANAALAESRAALREREERLRLILDSATGYAIFTTGPDRRVTSWNAGAERLLGWAEAEIVGRSGDIIFTPEDRAAGAPERDAARALAEGRAEDERWHVKKDGSRFWGSGLTMPLRDPADGPGAPPPGLLKVMRDETERRRAQDALRVERERLRLVIDSAADYAIFTTGPDWRVSSWNAGAERLLGWTAEEVVGRSADLIFTPEDRAAGVPEREAAKALAEGRASNERWHLRKDGSRFWGSGLTMALRGAEGDPPPPPLGLLVIMRDRTERRRAEERRELLVHELNHRVKNTLAVVQSLAAQTARGAPDLPSFGAAFQARLIALARAHDLLTREDWVGAPLHAVARAALEPLAIDETRVDLSGCASDVVLPPGAALALAMAVHELATNALKHGALSAPDGRVSVACRGAADPGGGAPVVEWVERGGPPVAGPPAKRGFGLRLLGRGLMAQAGVGADLRFEPEGVRCTLRLPSPLPTASPANEP